MEDNMISALGDLHGLAQTRYTSDAFSQLRSKRRKHRQNFHFERIDRTFVSHKTNTNSFFGSFTFNRKSNRFTYKRLSKPHSKRCQHCKKQSLRIAGCGTAANGRSIFHSGIKTQLSLFWQRWSRFQRFNFLKQFKTFFYTGNGFIKMLPHRFFIRACQRRQIGKRAVFHIFCIS